jgi:hypothetical protein
MKSYPSIDHKINGEVDIYAFDKLDGSNIRAEWSLKRGLYKFGTRKRIIDITDRHLGKSVKLIKELEESLHKICQRNRWHREVVFFFEFWGPHSFAGQHRREDDHKVTLIDVSVHKQGFLPPRDFIKSFEGKIEIPKVFHHGKVGPEFVDIVKQSALEGMTFEGVVCKAKNPRGKKTGKRVAFKIKSQAWLDKLKEECGEDEKKFEMLK